MKSRRAYDEDDELASESSQTSLGDASHSFVSCVRTQMYLPRCKIPRAVASVSSSASPSKSFLMERRRSGHAQVGSATMPALAAQNHADHVHTSRRHFSASSGVTNGNRGSSKLDINLSPKGSTTGDAKIATRHHDREPISMSSSPPSSHGTRLTHVDSNGEAHMVDVGSKSATHRVAIAQGRVRFSNTKPVELIQENKNKEGRCHWHLSHCRTLGCQAHSRSHSALPSYID